MKLIMNLPEDVGNLDLVKKHIVDLFRKKSIVREVFPIEEIPDSLHYALYTENDSKQIKIPVIHKEYKFKGVFNSTMFYPTLEEAIKAETILTFTGEHKNWDALGVEGLSTARGRNIQAAKGSWPDSVLEDIREARKTLHEEYNAWRDHEFILVVNVETNKALEETFWEGDEPMTYISYMKKEGLIDKYVVNKYLYNIDGEQNIALFLCNDSDGFWVAEGRAPEVRIWETPVGDDVEYTIILRETLTPIIGKPESIVEIVLP